jgi:hypothetical protein
MRNASMYVVNLMMIFYGVVEPQIEARSADLVLNPKVICMGYVLVEVTHKR